MDKSRQKERQIIKSLDEVPDFASEDEEREWWATHDLAVELGEDGTERHQKLIRSLARKTPKSRKTVVS